MSLSGGFADSSHVMRPADSVALVNALQRLDELGITLPPVAAPLAAYVPARRTGSLVYTSGQLPLVDGSLPASGKVGAAVHELVGLDAVVAVVKVVGYVASAPDFTGQPGVVNGASELLGEVFGDAGRHARSAVGVAVLPLDAPVEVEVVVEVG